MLIHCFDSDENGTKYDKESSIIAHLWLIFSPFFLKFSLSYFSCLGSHVLILIGKEFPLYISRSSVTFFQCFALD